MKENSSQGWVNGGIGVLLFSGSLPATRVAVMELSPLFLTVARASVAGICAFLVLLWFKKEFPSRKQIPSLVIIALGVVVGFPLLSAFALEYITSARSIVILAMLPVSTAVFAVLRSGERPSPIFWFFSLLGSVLVMGYAFTQGFDGSLQGDLFMLLAVLLCGLGYAEGAKLSKSLGGWQVISWALIISLPLMLPLMFLYQPSSFGLISFKAWFSLGYVSLFSMFIGFIFWYKGLAQGGTATVGQLQLLQPLLALGLAALLLKEDVSYGMLIVTFFVILCVVGTKKFAK